MLDDKYVVDKKYDQIKSDHEEKIKLLKKTIAYINKENDKLRNRTYRLNKEICTLNNRLKENEDTVFSQHRLKKKRCIIS
jgi:predicted RNase H-like nuclease (RuvC/YqgF family)